MRSAEQHLEQAERYADAVLSEIQVLAAFHTGLQRQHRQDLIRPMDANNLAMSEMMLHAAEVELKLMNAQALRELSTEPGPFRDSSAP